MPTASTHAVAHFRHFLAWGSAVIGAIQLLNVILPGLFEGAYWALYIGSCQGRSLRHIPFALDSRSGRQD